MRDIVIDQNGTPLIAGGDFVATTYRQYVQQQLYRALMNVDPVDITGAVGSNSTLLKETLQAHFHEFFAYNINIDSSDITVTIDSSVEGRVGVNVSYTGTAPDGSTITLARALDYSLQSGAAVHLPDSSWLSTWDDISIGTIQFFLNVPEYCTTIELPSPPCVSISVGDSLDYLTADTEVDTTIYLGGAQLTAYPILLTSTTTDCYPESETVDFSISVTPDKVIYYPYRYLEGFDSTSQVITSCTVASFPDGADISLLSEYGTLGISVLGNYGESGTISGSVTIVAAMYSTYNCAEVDQVARNPVFPLRPARGRIVAFFEQSVRPGNYMVQYKGYRQGEVE